ncbi:hypothetical protein KI387_040018 [Taxus chinensis]|uniref:Uncharacterized protein n=1 Tax=Taxus chinensis TaxID=29808 RepID=A0AA38C9J0_TAXCH|nr:hypothetical protein KI387_040018 [Taxus chinensis]
MVMQKDASQAIEGSGKENPSSFLFFLVADSLNISLSNVIRDGHLKGLSLADGPDPLSHKQFVDDTFLFHVASVAEARELGSILNLLSIVMDRVFSAFTSSKIGKGATAKFWEDSWNRFPALQNTLDLEPIRLATKAAWGDQVADYVHQLEDGSPSSWKEVEDLGVP